MARVKIDYGIDLGTTNSAIARIENGEVKIFRNDIQKDTTPSCVYFRKNAIIVGDIAYGRYGDDHKKAFKDFSLTGKEYTDINTFIEFKRTMGTDKTSESNSAGRSFTSEALSAEVLKTLKSFVRDEEILAAVITVPTNFRNNQIDATQRAAELAGFKHCELLPEPIAASIAYGVSSKSVNGYWLVFDFGGGTFDAALMRVEEGIMKVVDTEGDNHLGGKDLDYAIVDHIIIPYLKENYQIEKILSNVYGKSELRETLKSMAEEAKIAISPPSKKFVNISTDETIGEDDAKNELDFEFKLSLEDYETAVAPIFQRAIDISKKMLEKNNLESSDLEMVLLVGGPTLSQTLRKMLKDQMKTKIDTTIDPMTCVAVGAALHASSIDIPTTYQKRDRGKIQLILKYPSNTVETEIDFGVKIDRSQTSSEIPLKIFIEINRKDKAWSSGKFEIKDDADIIPLLLSEGKSNGFEIKIYDEKGNSFLCEPSLFNIIQGITSPNPTLSYSLGIEVYDSESSLKQPLDIIVGLEKNRSLPAKGKGKYKTQKDIRPGNVQDKIMIPIYEGEANTKAIYNQPAGYVVITGEDLPKFLPKGSDVEIALEVDKSRRITGKIYFSDIDETIERIVEADVQVEYFSEALEKEIKEAKEKLNQIENESNIVDLSEIEKRKKELDELNEILENGKTDYNTKTKVKERLRNESKEIDNILLKSEWSNVELELNEAIEDLLITNQRYGDDKNSQVVSQIQLTSKKIIREMNVRMAKDLTIEVRRIVFQINFQQPGYLIGAIKYYDEHFGDYVWKNRSNAKKIIEEAKNIIINAMSVPKLQNKIREIWDEQPDGTPPPVIGNDEELLTRY